MGETLTAVTAGKAAKAGSAGRTGHLFYSIMAVAILIAAFGGFAQTYYLKTLFGTPPLPLVIHIHAMAFTAWLALFVAQTTLIRTHRVRIHQRLGYFGACLAAAMAVLGFMAAVESARLGHGDGELTHDPIEALITNLISLGLFVVFFALAYFQRRNGEAHKRWMLLATTAGLMPAAIGRWPIFGGKPAGAVLVIFAFVLAGPIYDLISRRRIHPVYIWGLILYFLLAPPVRLRIARTNLGHDFGASLIRGRQ